MRLFTNLHPFFAAEGDGTGGGLSIDDLIENFGQDDNPDEDNDKVIMDSLADDLGEKDDKSDEKKDEKSKTKSDAKSDKSDKSDESDEEKKEEDTEDLVNIPKRQEILKAFPDLFKKFPQIERVMYREREYTELFSSLDDARDAVDTVQQFDKFQENLLSGNIESVFTAVKDADGEAWKNTVDNIMPQLQKVDNEAYLTIVGNIVKQAVQTTWEAGKSGNNEDLQKAARMVYQFVFGNTPFEYKRYGTGKTAEKSTEKEEHEQFMQERFETAQGDLTSRVNNVLRSSIMEVIDPKNAMTPYVKRNAVQDVIRIIDDLISDDARFVKVRDGLWEKARQAKFSNESLSKVRQAWLTKARALAPDVIRKVRNEALKNVSRDEPDRKNRDVVEKVDEPTTRRTTRSNSNDNKTEIPKGMRSIDFLMQD